MQLVGDTAAQLRGECDVAIHRPAARERGDEVGVRLGDMPGCAFQFLGYHVEGEAAVVSQREEAGDEIHPGGVARRVYVPGVVDASGYYEGALGEGAAQFGQRVGARIVVRGHGDRCVYFAAVGKHAFPVFGKPFLVTQGAGEGGTAYVGYELEFVTVAFHKVGDGGYGAAAEAVDGNGVAFLAEVEKEVTHGEVAQFGRYRGRLGAVECRFVAQSQLEDACV